MITVFVAGTAAFAVGNALGRFGGSHATWVGLGICAIFALAVRAVRAGTWGAATIGALSMAAMYLATVSQPDGPWWRSAIPPVFVLLAMTLLATRFRRTRKEQAGLAESRQGRVAAQVCANLGVATVAAALAQNAFIHRLSLLAMAAAFVEATADTLSSEIGQAIGGRTLLLTQMFSRTGRVKAGIDGAVSLSGTLAGVSGGLLVALACMLTLPLSLNAMLIVWLAGIAGMFFDSLLGATLERRGALGNNAVNFLSTAFAAALAAGVEFWIH